jgi:hypothetical protein
MANNNSGQDLYGHTMNKKDFHFNPADPLLWGGPSYLRNQLEIAAAIVISCIDFWLDRPCLPLFEIALVLVRFCQVARFIVNANHCTM